MSSMIAEHPGIATCILTSPVGELQLTCCQKGVHRLSLPEVSSNSRFKPDIRFVFVMLKMLVLKIHNLTFNDAQIDFNDTQFV